MSKKNKSSLLEKLKNLLQNDKRFIADGQILKNNVVEHAIKLDKDLVTSTQKIKGSDIVSG